MGSSKHQQRNPQTRSQNQNPTTKMKFAKTFALATAALVGFASAIELEEASTCTTNCAGITTAQTAIDNLSDQPSTWAAGVTEYDNLLSAYETAITNKCDCAINGAESLTLGVAAALPMVAYALQ